jgi:hypothetical protein
MNQEISFLLIKLDKLVGSSPLKEVLPQLMEKFSENKTRWISEAIAMTNHNSLYQVYHKDGGDKFV